MIANLVIKNFKSIEDVKLELKPLTIFTGPNSSGKSNLLEGLAILAQTTRLRQEYSRTLDSILMNGEFFRYPYPSYDFIAYSGI